MKSNGRQFGIIEFERESHWVQTRNSIPRHMPPKLGLVIDICMKQVSRALQLLAMQGEIFASDVQEISF